MRHHHPPSTEPAQAQGRVAHLVLTGGPGAGKTTALAFLVSELTARGWQVLTVPEAATMLVESGAGDLAEIAAADPHRFTAIQDAIVSAQLGLRATFDTLAAAYAASGAPVVVIHDRGVADNAAYIPAATYAEVLNRAGTDQCDVLGLYDAVLHLRSAAVKRAGYEASGYTVENNVARTENVDLAASLDEATLTAWSAHPHLLVIAPDNDFAAKLDRVLAAALTVLGDPDPVEVERKFLLAQRPDLTHPLLAGATCSRIEQTYLAASTGEQRVRARTTAGTTTYCHTTKTDLSAGRRVEVEQVIGPETYELLRNLPAPGTVPVVKNRYVFFDGDHRFELDEFVSPPVGWVCEVELVDPADHLELPTCLNVDREVTDDPSWRNRALATRPLHR